MNLTRRNMLRADVVHPQLRQAARLEQVAITVCRVCRLPIEPRTEAEVAACDGVGVHLGECWQGFKRGVSE